MMTHDEMIAVIRAHKEGRKVEGRMNSARFPFAINHQWNTVEAGHEFSFHDCEYRVAPEPRKAREWTLVEWLDGEMRVYEGRCNMSLNGAPLPQIRVREVLDEKE